MQVIIFDPGNFTPHYNQNLCRALASLDVQVELVSAPPLFEQTEEDPSYSTQVLFFKSVGGSWKKLFQPHSRLRQTLRAVTYPLGLWRTWRVLRTRTPGSFHVQWALFPLLDAILLRMLRGRGWGWCTRHTTWSPNWQVRSAAVNGA